MQSRPLRRPLPRFVLRSPTNTVEMALETMQNLDVRHTPANFRDQRMSYGTYRPLARHGSAWLVRSHGMWRTIVNSAENTPATLLPNWTAVSCLDLDGCGFILLLRSDDGVSAGWVLTVDLCFVCDLAWLSDELDASLHRSVRRAADEFARELRRDLLVRSPIAVETILHVGGDLLNTFSSFADSVVQICTTGAIDNGIELTTSTGFIQASAAALGELLRYKPGRMDGGRYCSVQMPALSRPGGTADQALAISAKQDQASYRCRELGAGLTYYFIQEAGQPTALYFPNDNLMITEGPVAPDFGRAVLGPLTAALTQVSAALVRAAVAALPDSVEGAGLMTYGIANFGHAIWDEFQAFESFIDSAYDGSRPLWLLASTDFTGMDLYGPVEDLYPEFQGRVIRKLGFWDVFADAIKNRVEIVMRTGQAVRHNTRSRINASVMREATLNGWWRNLAQVQPAGHPPLPVLTFGIRLTNRRPADFFNLYVRLARYLRQHIGPYVLVLDGINGSNDSAAAATFVFNGRNSSSVVFAETIRDGSEALDEERHWANKFCDAFSDLDLKTINCVGMPILENLFWMKQSDFFVAPMGGGLAKLRWALDVPGYVLISQTNLEKCLLLHAYDSPEHMERPYTNLFFNTASDVKDLPLVPPRDSPAPPHGIPHPEDFIVDENVVFPAILDAYLSTTSSHVQVD